MLKLDTLVAGNQCEVTPTSSKHRTIEGYNFMSATPRTASESVWSQMQLTRCASQEQPWQGHQDHQEMWFCF